MGDVTVSAAGLVVAGVDGSDSSTRAAVHAAECARRRGLGLLVVHVTPRGGGVPMAAREIQARFGESATALVEAAAAAARAATGLTDITAAVIDDYPVDGLLALSSEAALLVTGRRGIGGLPGLLLGSTAGALVQHAECPVIALPDELGTQEGGRLPVVVGVEGRPGDDAVLAFAVEEAAARGVDLRAVHAWRDVTVESAVGGFGPVVDWSAIEAEEQRQLSEALAGWRSGDHGVRIEEVVARDRAATALLHASASAQLLVVGHRHRSRLARLGSTTHAVLHRAACPVAVVPLREQPGQASGPGPS
ncbi:Nucleotide-binding universal stress protein, UspA family [Blastococcus aggregatus]|uniref:Nucleotide-binding universal stress protein, UspA family n=1 Tax=Blastococcus aggregatus TaxID=38502 RepID=A0A285V861_9ACTN|nr:universal stress protein [Blastococcus aggregatus]SOC50137.1 Nucleotide-binding universal stress protein, UspA family [Blastococcus aggregatus]